MNPTKCRHCNNTLLGNEYMTHWQTCRLRKVKKNKKTKFKKMSEIKKKVISEKYGLRTKHKVYDDPRFRALRYPILSRDRFKCLACNRTDLVLHVDHIKPVSKYPELAFEKSNLQTLCSDCNLSKGNLFEENVTKVKNNIKITECKR